MSTTKVVTGKVRFSYAHVWTPTSIQEGQEPKYSTSILIPKSDTATLKKIEDAIKVATEQGKSNWDGKIPKNLKLPLRDGDEEREDDPAYAGMWFLNASTTKQPGIVDKDRNEILDKDEFYSGCYGRVSLNFYPFSASGNKGIAVGLNNIQKLADGERLGGEFTTAEQDFSDDFDDLD